ERLFEAACGHPGYVAAGLAVAWHPDGRRLDFVDRSGPGRHQVRTFDLTARRSEPVPLPSAEHVCLGSATGQRHRSVLLGGSAGRWWGDPHPSASLHWHPDGSRIGLVRGSHLGLVGPAGWLGELTDSPVVSFAGWDAGGRWAAYVTAEPLPYAADPPDSQAGP